MARGRSQTVHNTRATLKQIRFLLGVSLLNSRKQVPGIYPAGVWRAMKVPAAAV